MIKGKKQHSLFILVVVGLLVIGLLLGKNSLLPTQAKLPIPCQGQPTRLIGTLLDPIKQGVAGPNAQLWTTEVERRDRLFHSQQQLERNARHRFQYMLDAMDLAPEAAMNAVLDRSLRIKTVTIAPGCVEEETTVEGRLEMIVTDFLDGTSQTSVGLRTADQVVYRLHSAGSLRTDLLSNMLVKIHGFRLDHDILFDGRKTAAEYSGYDIIEKTANPPVLGDQKTLVLLVNFQDTAQPNITVQETKDFVFGPVNTFFKEMSANRIQLIGAADVTGDVYGWYQIPINTTCTDIFSTYTAALDAADSDVDFTKYSRLIIAGPFQAGNSTCAWGGQSTIDRISWSTPDGLVLMSVMWSGSLNLLNVFHLGHELGHGFGNLHARFLNCGSASWADSGCSEIEYGDLYDVMGSSHAGHFNAPHSEYVGWLSNNELASVTGSGSYTLAPLTTQNDVLKALKIPRAVGQSLYVEYRQPLGIDVGLDVDPASDIFTGVNIHASTNSTQNYPYLLDATPPADNANVVLPLGSTWTDPQTGTTVTVTNLTPTGATVAVNFVATHDISPPQVNLTAPRPEATIGGDITLVAEASDNIGVAQVDFYLDGYTLPMVSTYAAPFTGVITSTLFQPGEHILRAEAFDAAGNLTVSNLVRVYFSNPPQTPPGGIDTTPPSLTTDLSAL